MRRLCIFFSAVGLLIVTGCDDRPKATFQSGRRVIGTYYQTPALEIVNYFPSTNAVQIFDGTMGGFTGTVTGIVTSSNATDWHMQIISDGRMSSGEGVHDTQLIDVPFPEKKTIVIRGLGKVTVWFLSDEELLRNADMLAK